MTYKSFRRVRNIFYMLAIILTAHTASADIIYVGRFSIISNTSCPSGYGVVEPPRQNICLERNKKIDFAANVGIVQKYAYTFKKFLKINGALFEQMKISAINPPQAEGTSRNTGMDAFISGLGSFAGAYNAANGVTPTTPQTQPTGTTLSGDNSLGNVPVNQVGDSGNSCSLLINMGVGEVHFDPSCGPECSMIILYPEVTETQFSNRIRGTSFKARINYADGTFLDQVGSGGGDMLTGETTYKSRSNFNKPHMILTTINGHRVWQRVQVRSVSFYDVSCVLK